MSNQKSIALVEFATSHTECLYSQMLFLKEAGYALHLIVPEGLRGQVAELGLYDFLKCIDPGNDFRSHWGCVFDVRRYLLAQGIRHVLLNTAEGNHARDLCLSAPRRIAFAGTLHHINKLRRSFTQELISLRVHKYFVLNDYLLDGIPRSRRRAVSSYYPMYFPPYEHDGVKKPEGELWVGIPGTVEFRRRDYRGFLDQLARHRLDPRVRFIILGKCDVQADDGVEVRATVRRLGLERQFVFFDDFIPPRAYFSSIVQCSCLLPLIHPNTTLFETYRSFQVSGTYNLAFAYAKPMLVHRSLDAVSDFQATSCFYEMEGMIDLVNSFARNEEILATKGNAIREMGKFAFEFQSRRFIQFLES